MRFPFSMTLVTFETIITPSGPKGVLLGFVYKSWGRDLVDTSETVGETGTTGGGRTLVLGRRRTVVGPTPFTPSFIGSTGSLLETRYPDTTPFVLW